MTGFTVIAICVTVASLLTAAFVLAEAEYEKYREWRDLHSPMWEREDARRALSAPRSMR